ncbi:LLM class flavin-dependent oxidoreductase [Wenjunlia tyrosinilytica]|uniref:Luciferase-like domain-containing protein n=1 Tax=Wenjunlia tyrosinilytica TaxID=1544741 RepID=A0A917ZV92_9ACTN|nr:LLM class flavin-dependent oxidoreductase [Wenjunlia tyrosinilytica]GGO93805.1 hypothetical protein GCM10012280_47170 [Wenjunlia tyrosinilytica]
MVVSNVRFNLVQPGLATEELAERYRAAVEMAAAADGSGVDTITLEEHHGADDGWLPSPLALAGLMLGRTRRIGVTVCALITPLYDPLRLAEDLAVLDLAGGGRLMAVAGIGYRPQEYAAHGRDWHARGKLQDESLETLLAAWSGEPFEHRERTVRVTPPPATRPHPLLLVGGASKAAARRAARLGLPFFPSAHLPELEEYYHAMRAEYGTEGWCLLPPATTALLHITEDPDRAWAEYGKHLLHEAAVYAGWQTPETRSAVKSAAATAEELRAEGVYRMLTPDECVAFAEEQGPGAALVLHPLCGGMPVDEGWRSLHLFTERVLPRLKD